MYFFQTCIIMFTYEKSDSKQQAQRNEHYGLIAIDSQGDA